MTISVVVVIVVAVTIIAADGVGLAPIPSSDVDEVDAKPTPTRPPPTAMAAAPSTPAATVALTSSVPLVAVEVGLGPTENVVANVVAKEEQVAVEYSYWLEGTDAPM